MGDMVCWGYVVAEERKVDELVREMRQRRIHMVIVIDEYGSVAGLVTIEDLVEEIVGDIQDEYDREENLYEQVNEYEYIFDAKISIDEFNELMDTNLGDENYETLGGFLYAQLDKIPVAGDTITFQNLRFTVLTTRGRRITKAKVERVRATSSDSTQQEQADQLLLPPAGETSRANVYTADKTPLKPRSPYEIKEG